MPLSFSRLSHSLACCALFAALGCEDGGQRTADAGSPARDAEVPEGTLFGGKVTSYVRRSQEVVTAVGVIIPRSSFENAPLEGPFRDELVLEMPVAAKQQTFVSQLRVNWLAHGHGPAPYAAPHFDFHFYRGDTQEIDAIACTGAAEFPADILTPDHQYPSTCVASMGYHAWPTADALPNATFTASLILGYVPSAMVFIEPMISRERLLERRDFELPVTPPKRNGGAPTRFPTRVRGVYDTDSSALHLELDTFVDLE